MRRDRDGGRAGTCQELHADLMVVMKERSGVWLGSPSRRLRRATSSGNRLFHAGRTPRWSHDQPVFCHLLMRGRGRLGMGGRSVGSVRSYGDEEGEESGSEYGRSCMLAMRKDEEGDE